MSAKPGRWSLRHSRDLVPYIGAVLFGAVLIVTAAINQPYNQNELKQMGPYDSNSLSEIASGTRQPPLDPWLGALVQHLLGEGQLRQRLVPVLAGIGTLALMAVLVRRLGLGMAGALGVWVMATAPLMVRYSAYARPYALPLFLSMLYVYAAQRWLDDRSKSWLAVAGVAAVALPLTRVPEPTIFLLVSAVTITALAVFRHLPWPQAGPLIAIPTAALVLVGYPMYRSLASEAESLWDPSPSGFIQRFDGGVREVLTGFLPLLASRFPWWPLTLLVLVAGVAIPRSRRQLREWWFAWPLFAAPVAFALAFYFLNPHADNGKPYNARYAIFFVPGFALMVVALASAVAARGVLSHRMRIGVGALLAAALVSQLPATSQVLLENEAADFEQVADVLTHDLPPDAIVLYDTPGPIWRWHQPFTAKQRYMGETPFVGHMPGVIKHPERVPQDGPVYFLLLDSECAYSSDCVLPPAPWDGEVSGWRVKQRFDKFTLYEPTAELTGRAGALEALRDFSSSLGPALGARVTLAAAALLTLKGRSGEGKALIRRMYKTASPEVAQRIRAVKEDKYHPFRI